METVEKDSETYVSNINYNEKGQRTAIYYGNGSKTKYEYDPNTFRLTRLLTTRNNGIDILQDISYIYDPVGNIVEMNDAAQQTHYFSNSVVEPKGQYEYDALYRLKNASGRELAGLQLPTHDDFVNNLGLPNTSSNAMQNFEQQYTYDQLGNIMQMKSVGKWTRNYYYNFNTNNYLLGHSENTTEYTNDAHGNMLSMPHLQSLIWDFKDELKEVTLNASGDKAYYVYDASGNRVRKVVEKGNITEERFYVGDYEVYRKTTSGTLDVERTTVHISDDQKRIAMIDNDGTTETIRYQIDNHLGSASLELDENAAIISYEEYHPFGTTSYHSSNNENEVKRKRYRYVGKERDEVTGLYYYGARYYAAWIARFVSVDPIQDKFPELTPYQYGSNNPVTNIDLDGLEGIPSPNIYNLETKRDVTNIKTPDYSKLEELMQAKIKQQYKPLRVENSQLSQYNQSGLSETFLQQRNDAYEKQHQFNETLYKFQEISPVTFGNPGQPHGAGAYSALGSGVDVYSAIEGGYGIYKAGSSLYKGGLKLFSKSGQSFKPSIKNTWKKYKPELRDPDLRPGVNPKTKNSTEMVSEWRRPIETDDISSLRESFLGDDFVKVDKGKWMSIDGKRMFRSVPDDFLGTHGMGKPPVSGQGHVHLELLRKTPSANYVVTKNIHIPLK